MKISNSKGDSFALEIVGYQFPDVKNSYWDSNWLSIKIDASQEGASWSATDSALTTFEVAKLAEWLETIHISETTYSCVEPNLIFRIIEDLKGKSFLRVYFEFKFRPPWKFALSAGREDLWIDFELDTLNLPQIAQELRSQLQHYPQRVFR